MVGDSDHEIHAAYLALSGFGEYGETPGNRGALLLRRDHDPLRYVDPDGREGLEVKLFGQTFVAPWDADAAGLGDTLGAYVDAGAVAASGALAGAGGGAASGCAAGAGVGFVAGGGVGAGPGCAAGASAGTIGGGIAGLFSAAFEDTQGDAAMSGLLSGLLVGPFGGASAAVKGGAGVIAGGASRAGGLTPTPPTPPAMTVGQTTNARLQRLAEIAESGGVRWVAGDAELYAAHQAASRAVSGKVGSGATRLAWNKLRQALGKLVDIRGQPIHHWRYPMSAYGEEAMSATNLYLTASTPQHVALHRAIGTASKPFVEMAWGIEQELQSMFNFWLTKR